MPNIRAKVVCLFRRNGKILLAEGYDPAKDESYLIPIGREIEFREKAEDAAKRETFEEISATISNLRLLGVSENLFSFDGQQGHEIVFVYEATLDNEELYFVHEIVGVESNGEHFLVKWFNEESLNSGRIPIYPDGIIHMLWNI
jgi:ADP-ribose pyrophosphatase YjhB (NUDIX family)